MKNLPKRIAGTVNAVDVHVGQQLRLRRTILGLTQTGLAKSVGLTFQQVQKYERGSNRIGASRLYDLSQLLDVSIEYFYEDMSREVSDLSPGKIRGTDKEGTEISFIKDPIFKRETLELVRSYFSIKDPTVRKRVLDFTKSIGE